MNRTVCTAILLDIFFFHTSLPYPTILEKKCNSFRNSAYCEPGVGKEQGQSLTGASLPHYSYLKLQMYTLKKKKKNRFFLLKPKGSSMFYWYLRSDSPTFKVKTIFAESLSAFSLPVVRSSNLATVVLPWGLGQYKINIWIKTSSHAEQPQTYLLIKCHMYIPHRYFPLIEDITLMNAPL